MRSIGERQATCADDLDVLKITLRPAPIANGDIDEGGRTFLPRAFQVACHAYLPARAADERCFYEVVREHVTTKGPSAAQLGQATRLSERCNSDDCIVAPVIPFVAGPRRDTPRDERAVDASRELLQARKETCAADEQRDGLQDAELRVRLHSPHQLDERLGSHQAVGIEHDHVVVAPAPALDELFDVPGFASGVVPASAIPYRHDVAQVASQAI